MRASVGSKVLRVISMAVTVIVLASMVVLTGGAPAQAALVRPFTPIYSTQTHGAITMSGNTVLTCPPSSLCTTALSARSTNKGNNDFVMMHLDADSDPTTFNSSGATIEIPDGATVLFAGLFWGAAVTAGSGGAAAPGSFDTMKLRGPGKTGYQSFTAKLLIASRVVSGTTRRSQT